MKPCYLRSLAIIYILALSPVSATDDLRRELSNYHPAIPLGLQEPDIPLNNPLTLERVVLGRKIFFDQRLSKGKKTSCATCHDPTHAFADTKAIGRSATGARLKRNAPSVINSGFLTSIGWDGKFKKLEDQIREPFSENGDMSISIGEVIDRIDSFEDYDGYFERAYGRKVDANLLGQALASFQRSLLSGNTRFDRYLFEGKENVLSAAEIAGYQIFIGKASCINCHDIFHKSVNSLGGNIATFTDHRFHNLGVGYRQGKMEDVGRYYETRNASDWGAFKTPMLRNVALTAPYMHDGSISTLREVVEFYNKGGTKNPNLSPGIRPLYLTPIEIAFVVAFLRTLTDEDFERRNLEKMPD